MSPYEIKIMLDYRTSPDGYIGRGEPILQDTLDNFIEMKLLRIVPTGLKITEKGIAYVDFLCAMPIPVCKWVTPDARGSV